jgi:hypothetical protein
MRFHPSGAFRSCIRLDTLTQLSESPSALTTSAWNSDDEPVPGDSARGKKCCREVLRTLDLSRPSSLSHSPAIKPDMTQLTLLMSPQLCNNTVTHYLRFTILPRLAVLPLLVKAKNLEIIFFILTVFFAVFAYFTYIFSECQHLFGARAMESGVDEAIRMWCGSQQAKAQGLVTDRSATRPITQRT